MLSRRRFLMLIVCIALILIVISVVATGHQSSPNNLQKNVVSGVCSTQNLTISTAPGEDGDTYRAYQVYVINKGSTPCTLEGYPSISLQKADGTNIGDPAVHNSTINPTNVTLQSDDRAVVMVQVPINAATYPQCKGDGDVYTLSLTPPGSIATLTVTTDIAAWCPGFSTGPFQKV